MEMYTNVQLEEYMYKIIDIPSCNKSCICKFCIYTKYRKKGGRNEPHSTRMLSYKLLHIVEVVFHKYIE